MDDDDKCPYFDQDDGTCIVKSGGEVCEKDVVLICLSEYSDCDHYKDEQKHQRYRHVFCLKCLDDIEDSYGWDAANYWNYCPQCGSELVHRPSPHYSVKKAIQRFKSFLLDKNDDSQ